MIYLSDIKKSVQMKRIAMPTRNGSIDDHFGHCEYYAIYTVDDSGKILEREEIPSPRTCGCKSGIAEKLQSEGVSVMLAGNMGNGALEKLAACGIEVIRGCSGDIETVLNAYLDGKLEDSGESCSHHEEGHSCAHSDESNPEGWHIG